MPKFAVNISMIGHPEPLEERLRLVADAGFPAVEFWFPHQFDMNEMARLTRAHGLSVALFDLEPSESHPYGHVADPETEAEFFRRLDDAFKTARTLDCQVLNVLQGMRIPELTEERQIDIAAERMARAAPLAEREGIVLCIEAINTIDRPGSFCHCTRIGTAIVDLVASPWVKFQYDVYHMQLMEGNIVSTLRQHIKSIGHVQFADPPGRNEPGTGEIRFPYIVEELDRLEYEGWVSLEYWPSTSAISHFDWLPRDQRKLKQV